MNKLPVSEKQILKDISDYLKLKKYMVMRLNSGMIQQSYKGKERMIKLSKFGTPDLMAFKYLRYFVPNDLDGLIVVKLYFIEVKRPGLKPTALQIAKMEELEKFGAKCIVATSVEDVEKAGL